MLYNKTDNYLARAGYK